MNYLYHDVPENMKGNFLIPLNSMKKKNPSLYKDEVKKYKGRESLLKIKVPLLDCLWNDVVHLTAVHPRDLKKALVNSGMPKNITMKWFKINLKSLEQDKTIVYLYKYEDESKDYKKFNHSDLKKYGRIPANTKKYFKKCYNEGYIPLIFHLVPHILYKGEINIKNCDIIEY